MKRDCKTCLHAEAALDAEPCLDCEDFDAYVLDPEPPLAALLFYAGGGVNDGARVRAVLEEDEA